MIDPAWVGISVFMAVNIVGWALIYNRQSKSEARHIGKINGILTGLDGRMDSIEGRIEHLETRLDSFLTNYPGNIEE